MSSAAAMIGALRAENPFSGAFMTDFLDPFIVHRVLSDKTYLSLGLQSPLIIIMTNLHTNGYILNIFFSSKMQFCRETRSGFKLFVYPFLITYKNTFALLRSHN